MVALLFVTGLGVAAESTGNGGKIAAEDATFIKEAAVGGMAEVELGKLAAEKGSSEQVKEFGQRMQKDHSKANENLKSIAAKKGYSLRRLSKVSTNRPWIVSGNCQAMSSTANICGRWSMITSRPWRSFGGRPIKVKIPM